MNSIINVISYSCPLLLASCGALFTEYTGSLALFLEGLISFSAFTCFLFTYLTGSVLLGVSLSCILSMAIIFLMATILSKSKANTFIAAIGMNLIFSASTSLFSNLFFDTRGVLTSTTFVFPVKTVQIFTIFITILVIIITYLFIRKTQKGIYFRVTGSDANVLLAKGVNPQNYKIISWVICAFFASLAGSFLSLRISSFVPNISSGKGWMALAAVFLGRKKIWKITIFTLIFCLGDYLSISIQNYIQTIPSSLLLSLPYLIVITIICADRSKN